MAEYRLTATDEAVIRTADEAYIPNDKHNKDWKDYEKWLRDGGVPDPYVPPPEPPPPPPDANERITAGVEAAYAILPPSQADQATLQQLTDAFMAMCGAQMAALERRKPEQQ